MARKRAVVKADPEQRLIDAALALAGRQGWRRTTLRAIADEAGLPLHEAYALHRSRQSILGALGRRIDQQVLAGVEGEGEAPSRDRLFDVLMRRFEILQSYRPGLRSILRDSFGDPAALLSLPGLLRSMGWMLEAAGGSTVGWRGRIRANLVAGIYLAAMREFLEDDTPDLARTMAALDRRLRHAGSWLGLSGPAPAEARDAPG